MRRLAVIGALVAFGLVAGGALADGTTPPGMITFEAKPGPVTFDHVKHVDAMKKDCKTCHDSVFPESKAPINYKESMHKKAETDKTSCGACHVAGGKAFESKGNCQRCHVKKPA